MPRVSHMSASRTTANNDGVFGDDDEEESVGFCEPKPAAVATPSCHDGENMLPMMEHPEGNQRHAVKHQNRGPRNYWVAFTICSICGTSVLKARLTSGPLGV
ncbi:hypothetical protein AAG570_011982 [Ranatra chinensis]|uniref:Uncharacterized protein n=1 Tax=Ranatra chinensis TaxID=642074 RepID=A0ABD0YHH9_9HEMI